MTTRRTLLTAALTLGLAWSMGTAHAQETIRACLLYTSRCV